MARSGSDHAPMFLTSEDRITSKKKHYRFLKLSTKHVNLDFTTSANPFIDFKRKIKNKRQFPYEVRKHLGNIFQQLVIREEIARIKEKLFEECPTCEKRNIM